MMTQLKNVGPGGWHTARVGALAGVGLTLAYSSLFALYAVVRSSASIMRAMSFTADLFGTLVANATAIFLASLTTALVLLPFTALLGLGTAITLRWLDSMFNPAHAPAHTLILGFVAALFFVMLFDFALQQLLGRTLNSLGLSTYLFWFGLPGIVHLGAGVVGAWTFHRHFTPVISPPVSRLATPAHKAR